jgi:hypothetical protein
MAAAAGTRRPRRRRIRALVAAAAAVLLVVGLGLGITVWLSDTAERTATASAGPVEVTVSATAANDGSALEVVIAGMRPGETCTLVAVDRDGDTFPAGDWPVSDAGGGRWRGWADVHPDDLAEVVVLGDGGRELVRLPL